MKSLNIKLIVIIFIAIQSSISMYSASIKQSPPVMTAPGNALAFDGVNDMVDLGNSASVRLTQGTIEAWIKTPNAGDSYRGIVVKQWAYALFMCNNELVAYSWDGSNNVSTGVYLNDNKWHHVALSFNAGVANGSSIYIDGVKKRTFTYNINHQGVGLGIGNGSTDTKIQIFNGLIDDVRVWNVTRSESQIQSTMYNELAGNESGLLAYYNFNQGTAGGDNSSISTITDLSSNALHGTLSNFSKTGSLSNFVESNAFTIQNNTPIATQIGTSAPLVDDSTQVRYVKFATTLSANFTRIALQEMKIFSDGLNLAVGKTITTSSNSYDYNVSKVVDGDLNTSWLSDDYVTRTNDDRFSGPTLNGPHYVVIDLGAPYNLDSLKLDIDDSGRSLSSDYSFDFLVSTDATNWSLVDHKDFAQGLFTYSNIQIQNIRYIKYACYYTSNSGVANLDEIQAFSNGVNVAKNKSATTNSGWSVATTVDDKPSTRWTSFALDHSGYTRPPTALVTYIVDLGEIQTIDSIQLEYHSATTFTLLVSANGTDWQKIDQRLNDKNQYTYLLNHSIKITSDITTHTTTTATINGNVKYHGGSAVVERGVCWSTSPNPTILNNKQVNGAGLGSYESTITGLNGSTLYYVMAYATNATETKYSKEIRVLSGLNVETDAVSYNSSTVSSGGYITAIDGVNVTGRGVCLSTNKIPTVLDTHSSEDTGTGEFSTNLTGLTENTNYYVRAYATTNLGTFYGKIYGFTHIIEKNGGSQYIAGGGGNFDGVIFTESGTLNDQPYFLGTGGWEMSYDGSAWVIGWVYSYDGGSPPLAGWDDGTTLTKLITQKPTITYDKSSLKEAACNDGSIKEIITITHDNLGGATFSGTNNEDFVATGKAIVRNLPTGLTAKITRTNSLTLTVTLTGKATAHVNTNDLSNVKIMFAPDAFTDGSSLVTNGNVTSLSLDFIEPVDMTITGTKTCADVTITADNNVTLDNNSTLTINSVTSANQITLNPGAKLNLANVVTVGNVVLKADDTNSFSAKIGTGMTVNGTVTFEKTMLDSKWYFLSFPCDVNVSDISMNGGGTVGVDFYIQTYSGANRATNGLGVNWSHITTGTLEAKKGYAFGLKTGLGTKTLSFVLNKAIVEGETAATVPTTFYDGSLGNNHKGWNLIGQPYLSKFAGSQVGINYLTTWNGSAYVGQSNSLVSSLNPFEAFFVQVGNTAPISFSLSGRQAVRSVVQQNLKQSLQLNMANNSGTDFSTLIFDNELSSDYEIGQDLEKWITTTVAKPQIYTVLNDVKYAYNALPISNATNLPVGYFSKTGGASTISASNVNVAGLSKLILIDNQTGASTDLLSESYNFTADAGTNNSRFSIIPQRISTNNQVKIENNKPYAFVQQSKLTIKNLSQNTTIRVYNITGKIIHAGFNNGNDTYVLNLKSTGMYMVKIDTKSGSSSLKVVNN